MIALFAARNYNVKNIVLTGNLTAVKPIKERLLALNENFEVNYLIPENANFATVIGAALHGLK